MTLYEFIKMENNDFDTYDTVFDAEVTVCVPYDKEKDWYDKFYNFIIKHVQFVEKLNDGECTADWYNFIKENIKVFRQAANDMWRLDYINIDDDDDLIYEWIKEIEGWLAGYVSETEYRKFMENYAVKIKT